MITTSHMYLLAPPDLFSNFQIPLKPLSSQKLYSEREPSLSNYYITIRFTCKACLPRGQRLTLELNVRLEGTGEDNEVQRNNLPEVMRLEQLPGPPTLSLRFLPVRKNPAAPLVPLVITGKPRLL